MKKFVWAFGVLLLASPAFAADPAPTKSPEAPANLKLELMPAEAQLAGVALGNAGTACDAGVQVYCQVLQLRGSLVSKLTEALRTVQPAPEAKK